MINSTGNRLTMEIRRQSNLAQQIARTQIEVSTGRRILSASDDPVATARVATIRQAQSDDSVWKANLSLGSSLSAQADSVLQTMSERLARAQELIVSGANQSLSSADRATVGLELRGIADEIDSLAAAHARVAFVASTVTAFVAVKWLLGYIQSHRFTPFSWYRIALGTALLLGLPAGS